MSIDRVSSKGFALMASLLLLVLLSGIAVGLMYMTNTEVRIGGNDLENNLAFYAAEGGMEKMTSDLDNLYTTNQSPSAAAINALSNYPPSNIPGISYSEYKFTVPLDSSGNPAATVSTVSSGPNAGLIAEIIPMTLSVTANRNSGAQVRMLRTVEVALIPVFQFGVFSDSDLSYFPGPSFDFAGRVHTNGNLFLATQSSTGLIFHSKITAAGEVIRDKLANGADNQANGYTGPVYIPNTTAGCDSGSPASTCINLDLNQGSYLGGPPPTGSPNGSWSGISTNTYKGWILNGALGANKLSLPFVGNGVGPIEIVRRPAPGEAAGSTLSKSRLYTKAQIRVLLADTAADLHPDGSATDQNDVPLDHTTGGSPFLAGVPVAGVGNSFFAYANTVCDAAHSNYCDPTDFVGSSTGTAGQWPLLKGFLRVEIKKADGTWMGVTQEWLKLGFARGLLPPASAGGNPVHPNAILILQEEADRNGDNVLTNGALGPPLTGSSQQSETTAVPTGANSQYAWYPINIYDPREGEVRDTTSGLAAGSCTPNGVFNVVELDVGNLRRWLTGAIGTNGTNTDYLTQNGYLLYFSDRRGMLKNPNLAPSVVTGEYGFEDTINSSSASGKPDGILEPISPGTTQSPEDVDNNNLLDNWGAANVGQGFGVATPGDPYTNRINCMTVGRKNWVSGARHAIKLVDGKLGNLPTRPDGTGGFTVASENPVYVQGDYNANAGFGPGNAAAAVIADSVTLLSNNWSDANDMANTFNLGARPASDTWYRLAIAAGKNIDFPQPTWNGVAKDYGTDGGVHNFLRYIENWGGHTLNYQGSLVSLFYSQYATGVFKCCTVVYSPPTRAYAFDTLFLNPSNLPPGTPEFQDVVNVSYRQDFTPY